MKLLTIRLCLSSAIATISCVFVIILNQSNIWDWEHSQNHLNQFISPATHLCIQLQYLAFAIPVMAVALTFLKRKRLTRFIVRHLPAPFPGSEFRIHAAGASVKTPASAPPDTLKSPIPQRQRRASNQPQDP